ncbi:hypothetical protein B0H13DRAFT_1856100 [Mycena leptocephala]|nr:hypothetical protein B0H13DRAFT_1856100 [Mycena leptocephala]
MLIHNLPGITRVNPTLVVAPSWVLGLVPAPSLIGQFPEHPVLCRRGFHGSHPQRYLSPAPLLVQMVVSAVKTLSCFPWRRVPTRSSQHPLFVSKIRPCTAFNRAVVICTPPKEQLAEHLFDQRRPGATSTPSSSRRSADQGQPAPPSRLEVQCGGPALLSITPCAPLLLPTVVNESRSPSPLYPGMRRPCAAFNVPW